eukprot:GEMP01003638.1.p1 GENE.GEMP01003638.1~~GEMP01003638.1.p1  ORF type:complete len:1065 (+),score=235.50 GEMP01003638.1:215-3409(+)
MPFLLFLAPLVVAVDRMGKCEGGQNEVTECQMPTCETEACVDCTFAPWTEWEPCTCEGLKERRRSVLTKNTSCGKPCDGTVVQTGNCSPECATTPQDCELSDWGQWGTCDKQCGGGQHYRERSVIQEARSNGKTCSGHLKETNFCNMEACFTGQACVIGEWTTWSTCSAKCDGGEKTRSRVITTPATHGGKPCVGPLEEIGTCDRTSCTSMENCQWGDWVEWTRCTQSCAGGSKSRSRMIIVAPKGGGHLCSPEVMTEVGSCNNEACSGHEPVNCQFEDWTPWDACSCTINGISHRVRHIQVYPSNGGMPCSGAAREIKSCNTGVEPETGAPIPVSNPAPSFTPGPIVNPAPAPIAAPENSVDCVFSDWTSFTDCSTTCSTGTQTKNRKVTKYPSGGGRPCVGSLEEMQGCENAKCEVTSEIPREEPVDFRFGPWEEWGICSVSCNGGERTRSRRIAQNANMFGKAAEEEPSLEVEPCNTEGCNCRDCEWGKYSDWGACTCTGLRERHREIQTHADECGKACEGPRVETGRCQPNCVGHVVDCMFEDWSQWSACSVSCGGGQRERQRNVEGEATLGGSTCDGVLKEIDACNTANCFQTAPCELSDWSEWTECSNSCGGGQQTRARDIVKEAGHGGVGCSGVLNEIIGCGGASCGGEDDCVWDDWSDFSPCTVSCGGGHKTRDRTIGTSPRNGGKLCDAFSKSEMVGCNTAPCAAAGCENGEWAEWGEWSECSATCGNSYRARHRVVAITASSCGHPPQGDCDEYTKCPPQLCNEGAVNCETSSWSSWSVCSCTCNGVQERSRHITTFAQNGGRTCSGPLKLVEGCNFDACGSGEPVDCKIGSWGPWGSCSVSCNGGIHYREREISTYPANRGQACNANIREVSSCNMHTCSKQIDCVWGEWSEWGVCSKECSGGQRHRYRHVDKMAHHGGAPCEPNDSAFIEPCNEQECGGVKFCAFAPWSSWSGCSVTCGEGKSTRHRQLRITDEQPVDQDLLGAGVLNDINMHVSAQPSMEKLSGMFAAGTLVSLIVYAGFWQMQRRSDLGDMLVRRPLYEAEVELLDHAAQ